jgi:hypothetical protein
MEFLRDFEHVKGANGRRQELPRPYGTRYYASPTAKRDDWSTAGASSSEENAVRAAVFRILVDPDVSKALVFDRRTGHVLQWVTPGAEGLRVIDVDKKLGRQ